MRRLLLLIALALILASCGGGADTVSTVTSQVQAPSTTVQSGTTAGATEPATADTSTSVPEEAPAGPEAPDFTLALGDGGSFALSDAAQPVYLVFWAEW